MSFGPIFLGTGFIGQNSVANMPPASVLLLYIRTAGKGNNKLERSAQLISSLWINKQPMYPVYQQTSKQVMSFPGTSSLSFDIKIVCAPICFFFLETNSWAIQTQICAHPDPCVCQLGERRLSSATAKAQSDVGALFKHPPSDCDTDMADCWLLFTNF